MRAEIKAMLVLAGLAAGCADQPAGAADLPGYREIKRGLHGYVTTIQPARAAQVFTREQPMRQCRFTR